MEFLGRYDILSREIDDLDARHIKDQLNQFQQQIPAPSKEEIKMLSDAVTSMEIHWGKGSFQFALNRIVELHDRFELYHKLLDEMMEGPTVENGLDKRHSAVSTQSTDSSDCPDTFSPSPPICMRRTSVTGKEIQVSVLDMDSSVKQAITLLDSETQHLTSSPEQDSCKGPDCLSMLDFLDELEHPDSESVSLLSLPEIRSRSYSAPEESTDGEIKRSRSFSRKTRQTISHRPVLCYVGSVVLVLTITFCCVPGAF